MPKKPGNQKGPSNAYAPPESARTSQTIWENGRDLLEVKERLEHGQFMNCCEANFPWERQTIQNMMNVADKLPKFGNSDISRSALYLLAQNSTPASARTEAIEKAEAGEVITHKQAKEYPPKFSLFV